MTYADRANVYAKRAKGKGRGTVNPSGGGGIR